MLDLEAFYPEKERFGLAMRLNGLLAAPGFALWLEGAALDVGRMLYTPEGKPRVAIVSIAHLSDGERMFFVTLLLNQVVSWMRAQSGTASLRAMLYMDEVAGYMPPVAMPPSKQAMLLLMKQARAFGLGVVVAMQNPIDIDYKALSNAGTWFLGRLQTERDKARLLDGLEGALAGQGRSFDREATVRTLSSLQKRVFFLHNVHDDGPVIFQTRWAMSYLRGPLTKDQIRKVQPRVEIPAPAAVSRTAPTSRAPSAASGPAASARGSAGPPVLPPQIDQFFLPATAATLDYEPALFATASVRFVDPKRGVDLTRPVARLVPFGSGAVVVDWAASEETEVAAEDLASAPAGPARFGSLPAAAAKPQSYKTWSKEFQHWLLQEQLLELLSDEYTGLLSKPGETEGQFRSRLRLRDREVRDEAIESTKRRHAPDIERLRQRFKSLEARAGREEQQASDAWWGFFASVAGTLTGFLLGRRALSRTNINRGVATWGGAAVV